LEELFLLSLFFLLSTVVKDCNEDKSGKFVGNEADLLLGKLVGNEDDLVLGNFVGNEDDLVFGEIAGNEDDIVLNVRSGSFCMLLIDEVISD